MFRNFFIISIFLIHVNNIISTEKVNVKFVVYKLNNGKGEIINDHIEVDKDVKGDLRNKLTYIIIKEDLLSKKPKIVHLGIDYNNYDDLGKIKITKGMVIFIKERF